MTTLRMPFIAAAALLASATGAAAQAYPTQPVKIVVPFSAGSATDLLARIVADKLPERWNQQQVIVENRPGVAGTAGVATSAADGHTLMVTSNGHTITPLLNRNLPFDPVKSFAGITQLATVPLVLIVPTALPAKTLKEFVELAKSQPGKFNYSSAGPASTTFIAGTLFKLSAKIDVQHVPYRGAPEAVTAVVRGDAQMYFTPANVGVDLIQSGQVRALAVATPKRLPNLPDVPTFAEAGMPELTYDSWFGLMAPAGTPKPVIEKINRDVVAILQVPDTQARLEKTGVTPMSTTVEKFDAMIKADTATYAEKLKDAITPN
jgi:tripartite-type tricarboxylate transporter receptor subunit TctC